MCIRDRSTALVTKAYGAKNGRLESITYGSGDSLNYEYDNLDRVTKVKYNNRTVKSLSLIHILIGTISSDITKSKMSPAL